MEGDTGYCIKRTSVNTTERTNKDVWLGPYLALTAIGGFLVELLQTGEFEFRQVKVKNRPKVGPS